MPVPQEGFEDRDILLTEASISLCWKTNRALRIVGNNISSPVLHSWLEPEETFGFLPLYPWKLTFLAQKQGLCCAITPVSDLGSDSLAA